MEMNNDRRELQCFCHVVGNTGNKKAVYLGQEKHKLLTFHNHDGFNTSPNKPNTCHLNYYWG